MTSTMAPARALRPAVVGGQLEEARARTLLLVAPLSDEDLHTQHDPLMSPILWDLGHIAHFEELWLTRNLDGPIEFVEMPGLYNPFEHPRQRPWRAAAARAGRDAARSWTRSADACSRAWSRRISTTTNPLARRRIRVPAWCSSTSTSTTRPSSRRCSSSRARPYSPPARVAAAAGRRRSPGPAWCAFPAGRVEIGTDDRTAAYDNERPRHAVELRAFEIDVASGYQRRSTWSSSRTVATRDRELWSEAGWALARRSPGARAPKYWSPEGRRLDDSDHGPHRAGGSGSSGLSRRAITRPRRSRAGRASGCRARSSGRRRRRGTRPPVASSRYPVG